MVQENAAAFVDWYIANKEGKESNYLSNSFKNDKKLLIQKVVEYAIEFETNFSINPFKINLKDFDVVFIDDIAEKLKEKNLKFSEYNRKNSNGIPKAIFGKSNYLRFLNERFLLNIEHNQVKNTTKVPYRKEFIQFLIEEQDFTVGSANSYATYIASANKDILSKNFKIDYLIKLDELLAKNDNIEIGKFLDLGLSEIIKCLNPKLKSKYKSGFIEYQNFINSELLTDIINIEEEFVGETQIVEDFFDNLIVTDTTKEEQDEFIKSNKNLREGKYGIILDQESILKNFYFRLTTQDRLYGDIFYPISLLKKIFYLDKITKKYFDELIYKQIYKIKIFSDGKVIYLNTISDMIISPGDSVVAVGNDTFFYDIHTEDGYYGSFKKMKVQLFREMAIDHITPMKELLFKHAEKLPKLKSITNLLKQHGLTGSGKELLKSVRRAGNHLIETEVLGLKDIEQLKIELEFLDSLSEFQLMDWKENLKKNKKK